MSKFVVLLHPKSVLMSLTHVSARAYLAEWMPRVWATICYMSENSAMPRVMLIWVTSVVTWSHRDF